MSRSVPPQDADRHADLAPGLVRHAQDRDLGDGRVGQDLLLGLARIDVGAARDVHVRGPAGDVEEALLIHVSEIAGAEPAIAERFRVGVRVVVVAGEHGRTADADLTRLTSGAARGRSSSWIETCIPVRSYPHVPTFTPGASSVSWSAGGSTVMLPVTSPKPKVLDEDLSEFLQRVLLVLPVHRRTGIDHVAQGRVIVRVDRRVLGQHLHDGRAR